MHTDMLHCQMFHLETMWSKAVLSECLVQLYSQGNILFFCEIGKLLLEDLASNLDRFWVDLHF